MAVYDFSLKLRSPGFIAGTDKNNPEMRAASIRGQLRYWLRAVAGAASTSLTEVRERETVVFGSTNSGSAVSVRVFRDKPLKTGRHAMLPHREGTNANESFAEAINPGQAFRLQLVTRPGVPLPTDALVALKLWSLLGGIGRRSRRMMGAIQVTATSEVDWYEVPETQDQLKSIIENLLTSVLPTPHPSRPVPDFPILHKDHSWIILGSPSSSYKDANQELFRSLLRNTTFRPEADSFGYAKGRNRRASPIIAQVRRIGDEYIPVITAFRSLPMDSRDETILRNFMNAAIGHYSGIHVWGGW